MAAAARRNVITGWTIAAVSASLIVAVVTGWIPW